MKTITVLVAILAVFLVIRIVSTDEPARPSDGYLTPEQNHYIALLDEALFNFGYAAGLGEGHPIWLESQSYVGQEDQTTALMVRFPRPNMAADEATSANWHRYHEGRAAAASEPFDEAEVLARMNRFSDILGHELMPAMIAAGIRGRAD